MAERRTWTMTVAGGASILLGAAGLVLLSIAALAVAAILAIVVFRGLSGRPHPDAHFGIEQALGAVFLCGVVAFFACLDLLLLATGISIWRVSPRARKFALCYATVAIPLGLVDHWLAFGVGKSPSYVACITLFTPVYASALLLAFYAIPSWRSRLRPPPWRPPAPPSSFASSSA